MRFIHHSTYSLLIKGFAGTGKTTLALTILRALGSKNNFFYISTRISPKQLFEYYPWLDRFVEKPKPKNPSNGSAGFEMPMSFEDARLDEPESLFERITNQLMDIASPIIIIDSWDAIASFMDKEARLNNERVLQTWRERAGAKLIFISEHPADTTLDFLVDGIVELRQNYYDNVKVREILMLKMRGVRIARASYIFTLENSMFRSFAPYKLLKIMPMGKKIPNTGLLTLTQDYIPTGYHVLDTSLGGGMPKNGVALLELDSHITTEIAMLFLGKIVSNFVSSGHHVLFQPFDWVDPQTTIEYLEPYISEKNLFKILWPGKVTGLSRNVVVPGHKEGDSYLAAISDIKQKHSGKLLLNITGADMMQKFCYQDEIVEIKNIMPILRTNTDLTIVVIRKSQKDMLQYFTEVSDLHLRMVMLNDTLFLQSLVPSSTLYSVVFDNAKGFTAIQLEPAV